MALPITIPNTFQTANAAIPLSQLDNNFTTVVNAINGIGNGAEALANVSITGGNVTVTTVSDQYGNVRAVSSVGDKSTEYTLAKADVGRYVTITTGGSVNITDNVFLAGDAVSIYNNTNAAANIICTITTAYIAGTDTDVASANLATRGIATVLFTSNVACVIAGNVS
jgi:hypothetical protein